MMSGCCPVQAMNLLQKNSHSISCVSEEGKIGFQQSRDATDGSIMEHGIVPNQPTTVFGCTQVVLLAITTVVVIHPLYLCEKQ